MKWWAWSFVFVPLGMHIGSCRLGESLDDFTLGETSGAGGFWGSDSGTEGKEGGIAGVGGATGGKGGIAGVGGATGGKGGIAGAAGATGGQGGTAGAGGSTGGCSSGCGELEECSKNGYCIAKSVAMPEGYSIDATQVTRSQYDAWLSTNPSIAGQASFCDWKTNFQPSCEWPPTKMGNHPVVCVDWCDAYAYCQAVDKRLCGKVGGGKNGYTDFADASKSQWYAACSSGGKYDYPYGNTFEGQTCNGKNKGLETTSEVGSLSGCRSYAAGYAGVYDMSGNVLEWEDSCDAGIGSTDRCRVRGGSFMNNYINLRCDYEDFDSRESRLDVIGFRCCSSP